MCCTHYKAKVDMVRINPVPDMQMLGSSNSAANKSMMSKIRTNGVKIFD